MASDWIVRLSTSPAATWWIRNVGSRLDPLIFRLTGGRFISVGPVMMPMLVLTTRGRRSGRPRRVQLAWVDDVGAPLVVASAMGQERHPAWSENLLAEPEVAVELGDDRFAARARLLDAAEKARVWERIRREIPQIAVYEGRTDRDIRVFRLERTEL